MTPFISGSDRIAGRMMETKSAGRIMVVDDEEDILEILSFNLSYEGYSIETALSAEEALQKPLASFDLMILDVMMGRMSGFRLAEKIRKEMKLTTPIIFLTARDTENDKLTGFSLGADDYLSKPFSVKELSARVKAVIRRSSSLYSPAIPSDGECVIDSDRKTIRVNDHSLELTKKEYELMALLIGNRGKIFSREEILSRVWGDDIIVTERTVDVTIARVRKKLGDNAGMIRNKSGYGYYYGN